MIRQHQKFFNGMLIIGDIIMLLLSFELSWYLRFESGLLKSRGHLPFMEYLKILIFVVPIFIFLQYLYNLYTPQRAKKLYKEILNIIKSNFVLFILMMSVLFVIKQVHISRQFIVLFIANNVVLLTIERSSARFFLRFIRSKGYNVKYVIIVGSGELVEKYLKAIEKNKYLGYVAIGILDAENKPRNQILNVPILGHINALEDVLQRYFIDEVIIALPLHLYDMLKDILNTCEKAGVKTLIIPAYHKYVSARPQIYEIEDIPLINTRYVPLDNIGNKIIKRLLDILVALGALILLSPLMLIIYVAIKLTSSGPAIFKQERIGYKRKPFIMYKFRTMKVQTDEESDQTWTTKDDDRRTKIGKILRKTSLDELPQLINVLKGDMSIIGPRPERAYFVEQFKEEIPKYMIKHHVRPGMTGWAQVNGWRGDTSIEERIKYDIYYIENWSLMFDLRILWLTFFRGFINKNAY